MCQPPEGIAGVCEHCFGLGTAIQTLTNQCRQSHKDGLLDEVVRSNRGRRVVPRTGGELFATVPVSPEALFAAGFLPEVESPRRVSDAAEVFAMTDAAPEEFEGRPVMGRRVVLVPQSAEGTPRSHFNVSNSCGSG